MGTGAGVSSSSSDSDRTAGLVVIGGGPAGHSAAAAYRAAGGHGRVLVISADQAPPYQRPPLSKDFLRGESAEDELPLESPEFYRDNDIELWLGQTVERLDPVGHSITAGTQIGYRNCVLATGCRPATLPVPGADHPDVRSLRSVADARLLVKAATDARSAVVIGSGFIGCEAAVSLAMRGLAVTVLSTEELPQLSRLGRAAALRIVGWLTEAGVRLVTGAEVTEIRHGRAVHTDGEVFEADLVVAAAGVVPNSELAERAGFRLVDGRVAVDERMATAVPGVFAAGDVAMARNAMAGRALRVEHWGEALRMGEIAGINAAGGDETWAEVPGFWSSIGDRTLKYAAWGDGYDRDELVDHLDGGFTVWYRAAGRTVGVLTHRADDDYDAGQRLIAKES
jgi:3-phenylpropionate/trans-cinnamate dioxygenase ferredoxin reductase subunit